MPVTVTILGSNSALPAQGRHPSAQVLQVRNELFLVDCGEGTQLQMSTYNIRRSRISLIFISHLHGDHIYGLPGLITSFNHYGRTETLTLYGPIGIKKFIDCAVFITGNPLKFKLTIHEFDPDEPQDLISNKLLNVRTIPLQHRIPTAGFIFSIKEPRLKIKPGAFEKYSIPYEQRKSIQEGADYLDQNGKVLPNSIFTEGIKPPIKYAYFSDTAYVPALTKELNDVNLLYHEATFLSDLKEKAKETKHSTAEEAALIAKAAGVKKLIIGHFSSRYADLSLLLEEARNIFPNTSLAEEGKQFIIE